MLQINNKYFSFTLVKQGQILSVGTRKTEL